jgi:hypothetical protein
MARDICLKGLTLYSGVIAKQNCPCDHRFTTIGLKEDAYLKTLNLKFFVLIGDYEFLFL